MSLRTAPVFLPTARRRAMCIVGLLLAVCAPLVTPAGRAASTVRVIFDNSIVAPPTLTGAKTTVSGRIVSEVAPLSAAQLAAPLEFSVALEMRNLEEFQARVGSGELVPYEEVQAKYLPAQADYDRVLAWLQSQGFTPTFNDTSRLSVFVQGTVAQIQDAFQVTMQSVTVDGVAYPGATTAPSLPARVSGGVLGVNGLQPYVQKHTHHRRAQAGAIAKAQTSGGTRLDSLATANQPPYLIGEIRSAYNGSTLTTTANGATTTLTGSGQKIAILIDALASHSDLTTFWSNNKVAQVIGNIEEVKVNGTAATSEGEETLDEEWSSGIAPSSKVRVYCSGALTDTALNKCLAQIQTDVTGSSASAIAQPQLHALSMSYGEDQNVVSSSEYKTEASYYATIANGNTFYGGVSIFASSGDAGSQPDEPSSTTIIASYPAADASITGVGGTDLYYASTAVNGRNWTERGWGEVTSYVQSGKTYYEFGGSGGGPATSQIARPTWQVGTGVASGTTRLTPDVAAAGGPTYADVEYGGTDTGFYGTSWSSPTWAGFAALINQARSLQGRLPLGSLNRRVYPLIGTASFYDTTTGNNSYLTPNATNLGKSGTGSFSCTAGYDEVTGVGTPNLANLVNALLGPTISGFSPTGGAAGTSVTITGTNFYTSTANPLTVSFNGTAGTNVVVNSAGTQITVTVPNSVTAGPITVTSIGDATTSSASFSTTTPAPDAGVVTSSPGNVKQGDNGDLFTLTVSNAGTLATSGTTSAIVYPGSGLYLASVSGSGWTCTTNADGSWTCTYAGSVGAGGGFPTLTASVNVSPSAPTTVNNGSLTTHVTTSGDANSANDTSTVQFTIAAATTTPSQQWRYQYFHTTANTDNAADTANPAGDGLSNLLKYALGLDPRTAEASPIKVDTSTGYLRLTTSKNANATDVTFSVQVNGDLTNPAGWTTVGTTVDQNNSTLLQVQDGTPVSGNAKRFLRLQVTR